MGWDSGTADGGLGGGWLNRGGSLSWGSGGCVGVDWGAGWGTAGTAEN